VPAHRPRAGVYLHLPFCRVHCPYCSFNVFAGIDDLIPEYVATLPRELDLRLDGRRPEVDSVYFGGGTPSLLGPAQVGGLLEAIAARTRLDPDSEITLEVDPGSADRDRLAGFVAAGVNRFTVGVQTFEPRLLRELGRAHDVADAVATLDDLEAVGARNVNIDLMFGLPRQTPEDFDADLRRAIARGPAHLSLYNLTVEPGTGFDRRRRKGALVLPSEDDQAAMYRAAVDATRGAGIERYEVSNFARAGRRSRHNSKHWRSAPYFGLGAGAHGFAPARRLRWWNLKSPRRWARAVDAGRLPEAGREELTAEERLAEAVLVGLRTVEGLDRDRFLREFGVDPGADPTWAGGSDPRGGARVRVSPHHVRLTDAGFLVADHLAERLLRRLDPP